MLLQANGAAGGWCCSVMVAGTWWQADGAAGRWCYTQMVVQADVGRHMVLQADGATVDGAAGKWCCRQMV